MLMFVPTILFAGFAVVFLIPSCRWLLLGNRELTKWEERLCTLFGALNAGLLIILLIQIALKGVMGDAVNVLAAVLSVLCLVYFLYKIVRVFLNK